MPASADLLVKLREKKDNAPVWTRWFWWLLAIGIVLLVFTVWYFAKRREAGVRAQAKLAEKEALAARLEAQSERDVARAAELRDRARLAEAKAADLAAEVEATAQARRRVEAALKGASSFDELDKIEKELR